eukprot:gene21407-24283_t
MHSIGRDSTETLNIVLPGILHALQRNQILNSHLHDIFDGATVRQLVLLYAHKEESVQQLAHDFMLQLVDHLSGVSGTGKRRSAGPASSGGAGAAVSVSRCCSFIVQHLEAHTDPKQEEVLMALLSVQPHLLTKSIASLSTLKTWEPVATSEYLGIMRFLSQLLRAAGVDAKSKTQLRAAFAPASSTASTAAEPVEKNNQQSIINALINSWIPPGLNKKDICKMLAHKELSLQKVGLEYVQAVVSRLQRVLHEAGISSHSARGSHASATASNNSVVTSGGALVEHCVTSAIQTYLPDFQLLINMRSRFVKLMSEKAETKAVVSTTTAAPAQEKEVVDDFDFNIDGDETEGTSAVQAEVAKLAPKESAADNLSGTGTVFESLYGLLLQVVETYLTLSPQSVSQVKFDILRILDDYVVWDNTVSTAQASLAVRKLNPEVLLSILRVLRQATTSLEVRWFGSQDDAVKMLINVIVAEDWRGAIKRSVLAKLMLLAAPAIHSISRLSSAEMDVEVSAEMEEVARKAKTLLKFVFIQSGLFVGHGLVDFELSTELNTWIGLVSDSDDSVLMVEPLLRVAYHWNTELSILAAQSVTEQENKINYLAAVESQDQKQQAPHLHEDLTPYSPVLYCAMLLLSSNFQIFSALLPKHIRAHIPTAENVIVEQGAFFDKYNAHFREEVQSMFGRVFCAVTGHARAPHAFVSTVRAGLSSAACTLASTKTFVEAVASVSQLVEIVSIDASSAKEVASSVKTLQNILNEVPALAELFGSSSAGTDVSASSKKKKGTPAKASSTKHVADPSTVLVEATRSPAHFAALCAGAVLHWEAMRSLMEGTSSSAYTQLSDIVNANWKLIFFVKMSLRDGESAPDADFYAWALDQWQNEVSCAEGLQSKASVFHTATQLLAQAALRINVTRFDLRASDNLLTEKDVPIVSENTSTTPKKSHKRTQADLSSGDSQSSAVLPVSLIALCQAAVNTSLSIAAASGGSPTIAALLSNATILDSLCSAGWFGQWVRRVLSAAVHVAVRSHASSTSSKKAVQKITNTSPELA